MRFLRTIVALTAASLCAATAVAASAEPLARIDNPQTDVAIFSESETVAPGEPVWIAIRFTPTPGWHTYWINYGDSGKAPDFRWQLPEGWQIGEPVYPVPERIPVGPLMNYGYDGPASLLVTLTPPADLPEEPIRVGLTANWLVCEEICIPESGEVAFTLAAGGGSPDPAVKEVFSRARAALPGAGPWPAKAALNEEAFQLTVDMPADEARLIENAYFFPHQDGLLDYTAEQALSAGAEGLSLTVPRPGYPVDAERVTGVLAVENAAGDREGFRIAASISPGDTLTAAAASTGGGPTLGFGGTDGAGPLELSLGTALFFALIGGMILNLMPCVFPVLSLKAFSLIKAHGAGEAAARRDGLAYAAGILASFAVVGGLLLGLRAAGTEVGWGFQLQSPAIITALALLLFVVGLNLAGLFEMPARFAGVGQGLAERSGTGGAFFTGVLATVVATPCTAPLMAPALGFALVQPPATALAIFLSLGLGLALPYLAVTFIPALRRILPRPGPWMVRVRQLLAFPMFLTAVWLLWVLAQQAGPNGVAFALSAMVAAAFLIWLGRTLRGGSRVARGGLAATALALIAAFAYLGEGTFRADSAAGGAGPSEAASDFKTKLGIEPWSRARVDALRSEDRPVFAYFTAAWCITCKVNERVALNDSDVAAYVRENDIAVLEADWTNQDDEIARVLERFGRSGVPLYLFYPAGAAEPAILPQILTPGSLIAAFEQARRGDVAS